MIPVAGNTDSRNLSLESLKKRRWKGQKQLTIVCEYLSYEGISTHSFRKWYATEIYKNSGFDIALVQRLLQHSSAAVTQRYIGIEPQRIEKAIEGHARLI
jgi:Site-specific recombinase XerD